MSRESYNRAEAVSKGQHPRLDSARAASMLKNERQRYAKSYTDAELFTPLCQSFALHVTSLPQERFAEQNFTEKTPVRAAPFGADMYDKGNVSPFTLDEIDEWLEVYREDPVNAEFMEEELTSLRDQIHSGELLQPEMKTYLYSLEDEGLRRDFIYLVGHALQNVKSMTRQTEDLAIGRFKEFFWTRADLASRSQVTNTMLVPVGEYGRNFAEKLTITTKMLLQLTEQTIQDDAEALDEEHPDYFRRFTARGRDGEVECPPLATLQEGITSTTQAITLLTAEKIPRYEDSDLLFEELIKQRMPSRLAKILPLAFVGPLTLRGFYVPGIITADENGKFSFGKDFIRSIHHIMNRYRFDIGKKNHPNSDMFTGLGCPVARRENGASLSGVDHICQAFLKTYNSQSL